MARGDGSTVSRSLKDGTTVYDVYWVYRDPLTGQRRRGSRKGFTTKTEAAKYRRQTTQAVETGAWVRPTRLLVSDYLARWVETVRIKPQTRIGYRNKIRLHITPHMGHRLIEEVTPAMLNTLYRRLETHGSPGGRGPLSLTTVRQIHGILSSAFHDGIRDGSLGLQVSPTARADPPTEKQSRADRVQFTTWSADQIRAFLQGLEGDHYAALWHLYATTGCRRSELLGLRWQDVDIGAGVAMLRQTIIEDRINVAAEDQPPRWQRVLSIGPLKTDRPHPIALDATSVAVLLQHRVHQETERRRLGDRWIDHDLVFCRGTRWLGVDATAGGPLDPERISESFQRRVRDSGLPKIRLHDLRHTWATLALQAGVPAKVVQERLGHATASITLDIYSHVSPGMDRDAAETVAGLFS